MNIEIKEQKIFLSNVKDNNKKKFKISLIGCGQIGETCIASLINRKIPARIVLIEPIKDYFGREKFLYESFARYNSGNITCSNDITASDDSNICLISFEYINIEKNSNEIFNNISNYFTLMPQIIKYSPNVIIIILTYPYFILTQLCCEIANIPKNRIFGLGTSYSTSEFKAIIAKKFNVPQNEVQGYVIGLNYYSHRIPICSSVNVCNVALNSLIPFSKVEEFKSKIYDEFNKAEIVLEKLIKKSELPRWAIGVICARICNAIFNNTTEVFTIATSIKGIFGIERRCCLSVPCSIGSNGIHSIIGLYLNRKEIEELAKAAKKSNKIFKDLLRRYTKNKKLL